MSEYQIIRFCAPTLAGLKTASLFCCDAPDEAVLMGVARASEDPVARTAFLHDAETMLLGETALSPVYFDGTALLQLFYNYIVSKIDSLVNDMEDSSITLMDILTAYNKK